MPIILFYDFGWTWAILTLEMVSDCFIARKQTLTSWDEEIHIISLSTKYISQKQTDCACKSE